MLSDQSNCQGIKRDGNQCTRSTAKGSRFCWQHSHGWRAKWRSLTRNQTLTFGLTVFGALATLIFGLAPLLRPPARPVSTVESSGSLRADSHDPQTLAKAIAKELANSTPQPLPRPNSPPRVMTRKDRASTPTEIPKSDWRQITDWQKVNLQARLQHYKGQKLVIFVANTEESRNYAQQFKSVLSQSPISWSVEEPVKAPSDEPVADIQLSVSDEWWANPPQALMDLKNTLVFTGIKGRTTFVYDPNIRQDELGIWVGPPSPHGESDIMLPLEVRCRNQLRFTDSSINSPAPDKAPYARAVTIQPRSRRFARGESARVFFADPVLFTQFPEGVSASAVGKVMRRNDDLQFTFQNDMNVDQPLTIIAASEKETHVLCVDKW